MYILCLRAKSIGILILSLHTNLELKNSALLELVQLHFFFYLWQVCIHFPLSDVCKDETALCTSGKGYSRHWY